MAPKKVISAPVQFHEGAIMLPRGMSLRNASTHLAALAERAEQIETTSREIRAFPWDVALAFEAICTERFGAALPSHNGRSISVAISATETRNVPWGSFELPNPKGMAVLGTYTDKASGLMFGTVSIDATYAETDAVAEFLDAVTRRAMTEPLYRGRAISAIFRNSDGTRFTIPRVTFPPLDAPPAIFNPEVEAAIAANILAPIRHAGEARRLGLSLKRGILLSGSYGTGKTMTAHYIAATAVQHGWTFVYCPNGAEIPDAIRFALQYQPAIVFAEDIDRYAGEDRTEAVNEILNTLDGIGTKGAELLTILTTNHPEEISPAMLRHGRIDIALRVTPPSPETVSRMFLRYAGADLPPGADLSRAANILAGLSAAHIRETVARARWYAFSASDGATTTITPDALALAAESVVADLPRQSPDALSEADRRIRILGDSLGASILGRLESGISIALRQSPDVS